MPESPFDDLSDDEQRRLYDGCRRGNHFIFAGEKYTVPGHLSDAHMGRVSGLFEVSPEQLIDVAKYLEQRPGSHPSAIERAYSLICEANVFSRNLKHWNRRVRRNHVSEEIHAIVEPYVVPSGEKKGMVPRNPVIQNFLKMKGHLSNEVDARKLCNQWIRETLRYEDFMQTVPWDPAMPNFNGDLNKVMIEKGWIRWVEVETGHFLVLPESTTKPGNQPRRKAKRGQHETCPWWQTKNIWWPNPSKTEQTKLEAEYFKGRPKHFHSAYHAKQWFKRFDHWLEIQDAIQDKYGTKRRKQKTDPETGRFS